MFKKKYIDYRIGDKVVFRSPQGISDLKEFDNVELTVTWVHTGATHLTVKELPTWKISIESLTYSIMEKLALLD